MHAQSLQGPPTPEISRAAADERLSSRHPNYPKLAGAEDIFLSFRPAELPPEGADTPANRVDWLTACDVEHFNKFGFTRPITVFVGEQLATLQRRFAGYSAPGVAERVAAWRDPRHWLDVCAHRPTLDIAQTLVGSENLVCHVSQFIDKGPASMTKDEASFGNSEIAFHQDASFNAMDAGSVVVWLALADADESNGCMLCLPGSHLHGLLPCIEDESMGGLDGGGHTVDLNALPNKLATLAPIPLRARAGQVVVLSDMLMHSSPRNPDPSTRLRPALTATYAAAELRVWNSEFPVTVKGSDSAGSHWNVLPAGAAPSGKI